MAVLRSMHSHRSESAKPSFRQKHFPPRTRLTRPSTKSRIRRGLEKKQSTLTQLDYVVSSSYSSDDDSISEADPADFKEHQPAKRRKLNSCKEDEDAKQSTLTQWDWLEREYDSVEEEEEINDQTTNKAWPEEAQLNGQVHNEQATEGNISSPTTSIARDDKDQKQLQPPSTPKYLESNDAKAKSIPVKPTNLSSDSQSNCENRDHDTFMTPQKPIKREIPSSQSPAETPLSTQEESQKMFQRTPLQEIPPNVVAALNQSPSLRRQSLTPQKPRLRAASVDDKENIYGTPTKQKSGKGSPTPQASASSSTKRAEYQRRPRNDASLEMPPPNLTQVNTMSAEVQSHNTIRSSQATTVDLTQGSPQAMFVPSSSSLKGIYTPRSGSHSPQQPSTPMEDESQLPFSHLTGVDLEACSPLSSIQDSADMVTVSQLLSESIRNGPLWRDQD